MRLANETHQSDWIMPPMNGGVTCLAASSTEVDVDLQSLAGTPAKAALTVGNEDYNPNPIGHYLNLQADGGDVYVCFADSLAHLGSLSTTATSTVTSNKATTTSTAGGTVKIPNGTTLQVKLPIGAPSTPAKADQTDVGIFSPARFLGFLCATNVTATLRIWQSSP